MNSMQYYYNDFNITIKNIKSFRKTYFEKNAIIQGLVNLYTALVIIIIFTSLIFLIFLYRNGFISFNCYYHHGYDTFGIELSSFSYISRYYYFIVLCLMFNA